MFPCLSQHSPQTEEWVRLLAVSFLFILYKAVIAPAVLRDSFECANPDIALLVLNAMMGEIGSQHSIIRCVAVIHDLPLTDAIKSFTTTTAATPIVAPAIFENIGNRCIGYSFFNIFRPVSRYKPKSVPIKRNHCPHKNSRCLLYR